MTPTELLTTLSQLGVEVAAEGDMLHYRAPQGVLTPDLKDAMKAHKPDLLKLLTLPCPCCSATDWRETREGSRWCVPCVLAGREPVVAVKVHSDLLDTDLWVVADDLPRDQWPMDVPVYTHAEVMVLARAGPDTLEWMHAVKTMFNCNVVQGHRKGEPHG